MKKWLLIIALVLFCFTSTLFARGKHGLGLYGNLVGSGSGAFGGGIGLTYMYGTFPVLGLEWMLADRASSLGLSCDWWIVNGGLGGVIGYYIGIGAFLGINSIGSQDGQQGSSALNFGGRIPFGLQAWVIDPLELFVELAPLVGFLPSLNINFGLRLGFRVHF